MSWGTQDMEVPFSLKGWPFRSLAPYSFFGGNSRSMSLKGTGMGTKPFLGNRATLWLPGFLLPLGRC